MPHDEIVELDQDTEDLSYLLTLMIKEINPQVDCGETYEQVIRFVIQLIDSGMTEGEAQEYGRKIAATKTKSPKTKH